MNLRDAIDLIRTAIPPGPATWADLGAGDGAFTRALAALLGPGSRVYAVDRDRSALDANLRARPEGVEIIPVVADFTRPLDLPGLGDAPLDGILLGNALHFVRDGASVLARLAALLRPGGRALIVEYDRRRASPWVPYPLSPDRLAAICAEAGLTTPIIVATRPSAFGGILYVASADRDVGAS